MLKYKTAPKSTIRLDRLEDLLTEELYTYIDEYNYVCIKGLFDVSKLKHSIAKLRSLYSGNIDNPSKKFVKRINQLKELNFCPKEWLMILKGYLLKVLL